MKLRYNKIIAACLFVLVSLTAIALFADKTADPQMVVEQDTANTAAYADYEEPVFATVVPNDLTVTLMSEVEEPQYEVSSFQNKAIAYVDDFLPVRTEPDRTSETIGKMYPGCVADVIERGETWSKISSGSVEGYVQNMYLCFDSEAEDLAILLGGDEALVEAVSIEEEKAAAQKAAEEKAAREAAQKAAAEKAAAEKAAAEKAAKEAEEKAAAEKAAKEAAEKAAQEASAQSSAGTDTAGTQEAVQETQAAQTEVSPYYMELSEEDIMLLACIVDWEAGYETYEGKLAVANVVLNRVRSNSYPNTVSGVIYQRGQFGGVLDSAGNYTTRWQTRLSNGPRTQECITAAREVAAGVNNVIGYLAFNGVAYCNTASYRSYIIIGNHCFYQR